MIDTKNYKTDILADTKKLIVAEDDSDDEVLNILIEDSINAVLSYCRLRILPYQLIGVVSQITADTYRNQKSNGVASVTEGDRRIEYRIENAVNKYRSRLAPFKAKFPSEIADGSLY